MSYPNPLLPSFTASLAVFYIFVSTFAEAQSKRKNKSQSNYLILVIYGDNLPKTVYITIFPGTVAFSDNGTGTIDTQDLRHFKILATWLFGYLTRPITTFCSPRAENLWLQQKMLISTRGGEMNSYSLGQHFVDPDVTDINREEKDR